MLVPAALLVLAGCAVTPGSGGSSVVGQWGGVPDASPTLDFSEEGTFTGNDGCNNMVGSWTQDKDTITLKNTAMTLMACEGIDTWLSGAATVKVAGMNLNVFNSAGKEIGTLSQEGTKH